MEHSSELEQLVNILAFAADVTRKLAKGQKPADQDGIMQVADDLEVVAEKLIEIVLPQRVEKETTRKRIESIKR